MALLAGHVWSGMFVSGFVTEKLTFDNVIQLNNVRSRVESFARAFIFHRAYAARAFANSQRSKTTESLSSNSRRPPHTSALIDGKFDKYERVKVCMVPQVKDLKTLEDRHLDFEEKIYDGTLMGLPCNKDAPAQRFFVDTKKHAPYQYPKPEHSPYQKAHPEKVWDSDNGSWVDKE